MNVVDTTYGDPKYLALLDAMADLHRRKAAGYGASTDAWDNFRESTRWGVTALQGCLVRMGDKYRRTQNLLADPTRDQVGETVRETLQDLAAYALIAICLMDEGKG